ncbi:MULTISPECIES: hypothetical protein [Methylobacterium]|jgi:hypothetical protein|uniref:hypothetical protein n=1 Tax=Methylobacterium TaxID=407 RepID=UPI0008F29B46|nr:MULTISPECIES: hypothetical protein [Methylobacterium]MBZ6413884.1 hypothetical protein [Methylobacterium sp.]SFF54753.1 hypothetical protein SAMN04487844_12615 [Methylobacterium sp. yr596]
MIVALSVLALLMLIGGLAAMVQGIPFIRLEVGWTMVIAGTVGASGGAVLLGLAAVVARLGRIERALRSDRAAAPLAAAPAFPEPPAPVRPARSEPVMPPIPTMPLPAQDASAVQEPHASGPGHAAALAAGAATVGLAVGELRLRRADDADPILPHEPTAPDAMPREPALHVAPVAHPESAAHEAPPSAAETAQASEVGPAEPVRQDSVVQESAYQEPAPPEHHEPAPPVVDVPTVAELPQPEIASSPDAAPVPEPAAGPHDTAVAEEPAVAEHAPEEPAGKTVIGTYDAGDNTYTMYADGTIDAETPAGRFHFASIEELKAFRSAGGEGAARSA